MEKDLEIIEAFIHEVLNGTMILKDAPSKFDGIKDKLNELSVYLTEVKHAAREIAAGNFESQWNRCNPYIGALKDLQSTFHHLTWQLNRVAAGDYEQSLDYLGQLSDAFNTMIIQLKERESLLRENIALTQKLASQQSKLLESQIDHQVERYNQLSKSTKEIKKYRHDMKNHLLCIDALLQDQNIEETRAYIAQLAHVFKEKTQVLDHKNFILNALLLEKLDVAKKLKVNVKTNIKIRKKLAIQNMDWCILFGNALDNALEALAQVDVKHRTLEVSIRQQGDLLCANISNSMKNELCYDENNQLKTSKKDDHLHGIGLKNIQECVRKYNGETCVSTSNHTFSLTFLLCGV